MARARPRCPTCAKPLAPINFGEPAFDTREQEDAGEVLSMGCCRFTLVPPSWACFACCEAFTRRVARADGEDADRVREELRARASSTAM